MKRQIVIVGLIVGLMLIQCSCNNPDSGVVGTVYPPLNTDEPIVIETEISVAVPCYEVNPVSIDHSFDEVLNVCLDKAGIDDYTLGEAYDGASDFQLIYYPDYSVYLAEMLPLNDEYFTREHQQHIESAFQIVNFMRLYSYDDPQWAEEGYRYEINQYMDEPDIVVNYSDEGCCFIDEDNFFNAVYYMNDVVFDYVYFYSVGNPEDYQIYLDICEELGLPTCDEVTEDIMGSSN